MRKVVIGVVVDEDTRVVNSSKESYSIIGFALLDLVDLSLSFVDKNSDTDTIHYILNSRGSRILKLKKHDKFCIEKKARGAIEYSFYHLDCGVIMRELWDISYLIPIYSKKLRLIPELGKSEITFNIEHSIGALVYECKKATISVLFGNPQNGIADSIPVTELGSLFHSPFECSYIYGSDMCIARCNSEDVVVPDGIKHIVFIGNNHIRTVVLPKSIDKITINNTTIRAIDTYYISKETNLSAVCSLIYNIFFYSTSISSNELDLLRYELHTLYNDREYKKFYELCKSDKNKEYLDEIFREINIVVY